VLPVCCYGLFAKTNVMNLEHNFLCFVFVLMGKVEVPAECVSCKITTQLLSLLVFFTLEFGVTIF